MRRKYFLKLKDGKEKILGVRFDQVTEELLLGGPMGLKKEMNDLIFYFHLDPANQIKLIGRKIFVKSFEINEEGFETGLKFLIRAGWDVRETKSFGRLMG